MGTATTSLTNLTTQVEEKGTCKHRDQIIALASRAAPFPDAVIHLTLDWEQMKSQEIDLLMKS